MLLSYQYLLISLICGAIFYYLNHRLVKYYYTAEVNSINSRFRSIATVILPNIYFKKGKYVEGIIATILAWVALAGFFLFFIMFLNSI